MSSPHSNYGTGHGSAGLVSSDAAPESMAVSEDILDDANSRLGRANGNVYKRTAGIEGVHDGQIMVRLKKKRFIVIDYSPDPNNTKLCSTTGCQKVANPKLVYDSDPAEPVSLYMRSGLCFTCQRTINEKRRSNSRKSPGEITARRTSGAQDMSPPAHLVPVPKYGKPLPDTASGHKRGRGGRTPQAYTPSGYQLSQSAVIIDGPVEGARPADDNYGFMDIGNDLLHTIRGLNAECDHLVAEAARCCHTNPVQMTAELATGLEMQVSPENKAAMDYRYHRTLSTAKKAIYQLTQWKYGWDAALTAADSAADAVHSAESANFTFSEHSAKHDEALPEAKAELETFAV